MNVLLSSASNKVTLLRALQQAVKRLDEKGIVTAGDSCSNVLTRHFCDAFWQMPPTNKANVDEIVSELKKRKITHILPSRDGELMFWSKLKDDLKQAQIHVIVSDEKAIELCLDKLAFGQSDLPHIIPAFCTLDGDRAICHSASPTLRYVVKERFGAGSHSIGVNLDEREAKEHAKKLSAPIFQPFIDGQEISVDAWLTKECKVKAAVCRVRDLVINGESQVTYTLPNSPISAKVTETLSSIGLSGPVVLQGIINDGQFHIIECNSRFGGASTLGIKAGVDSLYWSLYEGMGKDIDALPVDLTKHKITQVRAATDYYL
ncbi:ATP-grasp domain-containing protein [Alteromonas gracilis]|uniref:ATP-grasp domain-containing protein n=1 Tax=Alteromonas gracilis TaxID=1479524 RepID=UPI0037354BE5